MPANATRGRTRLAIAVTGIGQTKSKRKLWSQSSMMLKRFPEFVIKTLDENMKASNESEKRIHKVFPVNEGV